MREAQADEDTGVESVATRIVALLVEAGSAVDARDVVGLTPLFYAVVSGNTEAVTMLLDGGASASTVDACCGRSALHVAALCSRTAVIGLLLDRRVALDSWDVYGRTPLLLACSAHSVEAAQILLCEGAILIARLRAGGRDPHILGALACMHQMSQSMFFFRDTY